VRPLVGRADVCKVQVTLVEKRGVCPYAVGHKVIYGDPLNNRRPEGLCWGIARSLEPIVLMCALGATSWEKDDPERFYISCISKKGTVWRVERLEGDRPAGSEGLELRTGSPGQDGHPPRTGRPQGGDMPGRW